MGTNQHFAIHHAFNCHDKNTTYMSVLTAWLRTPFQHFHTIPLSDRGCHRTKEAKKAPGYDPRSDFLRLMTADKINRPGRWPDSNRLQQRCISLHPQYQDSPFVHLLTILSPPPTSKSRQLLLQRWGNWPTVVHLKTLSLWFISQHKSIFFFKPQNIKKRRQGWFSLKKTPSETDVAA